MQTNSRATTLLASVFTGVIAFAGCDSVDTGGGSGGNENETTNGPGSSGTPGATPPDGAGGDSAKWLLWSSGGIRLRGVNFHPCELFDEDQNACLEFTNKQDVQDVRDLGANVINASYQGLYDEQPPYALNTTSQDNLDNLIDWSEDVGTYVVIYVRTGPGRNEAAIQVGLGPEPLITVWTDQAAHDAWIDMWRYMAERYAGRPTVIGYNLMVEPHVNTWLDPDGVLSPEQFQQQHQGDLGDWNAFTQEITNAIREVDSETPIIINSLSWASASWFSALAVTGDSRTVYSFHGYDPNLYTGAESQAVEISYPSVVDDAGQSVNFNRDWLVENLQPVIAFEQQHHVPIYVGEFGLFRWVPGAVTFIDDEVGLFEERGWNYAFYVWRGDVVGFDAFNMEYGPDRNNTSAVAGNPLLSAFTTEWSQNTDFP